MEKLEKVLVRPSILKFINNQNFQKKMSSGLACFFIVFIMSMEEYNLADTAKILAWVFMIFPHFALSNGLNNINTINLFNQICDRQCQLVPGCTRELVCQILPHLNLTAPCCGEIFNKFFFYFLCPKFVTFSDYDYFDWTNGIGRNLVFMTGTGIVFFSVLLITEYRLISSVTYKIKSWFTSFHLVKSDDPIDSDVIQEKNRVKTMSKMEIENHNLVLKEMSKVYGKFVAVNDMSIAVEQ